MLISLIVEVHARGVGVSKQRVVRMVGTPTIVRKIAACKDLNFALVTYSVLLSIHFRPSLVTKEASLSTWNGRYHRGAEALAGLDKLRRRWYGNFKPLKPMG